MASFPAKICWGRWTKRENKKKIVPMSSYLNCNREFQKNSKKFQKIKKTPLRLLFKPKQVGKGRERETIKKIVPMSSYKTDNRKLKIGRAHV